MKILFTFLFISFLHASCPFCTKQILETQSFYETDKAIALYTHKPVLESHCLILPKRHIERFEDLSYEEMREMQFLINKVNLAAQKVFQTSSYLLLQKNGTEVGQTVPHMHFHYIARKKGDSSTLKFLANMFISSIKSPISEEEMQAKTALLQEALQD